ncbi:MAG: site-specific integrase [Gammaproteobacteria bacterium]|nr:site-specific integrase [Gammaproteobacteria bacterium]
MAYIQERKNSNGKKSYRVQVRLKGYPTQTATFERKTDAKNWAQQTETAIREGRHFKSSEAKRHTVTELIDRYTRDVLDKNPKKKRDQGHHLEWWKDEIGSYTLADTTPALIVECRDKLASGITRRKSQRSPATVVRYMTTLSCAFSIAVREWGWMEDNPFRKVSKPKEPRGRVRFLSDDETLPSGESKDGERTRLLKACRDSGNPFLYPVVVIALSTGARKNEIMGLKWQDVNLSRGMITLHETKNGERRALPLTGHALEQVKQLAKVRRLDTDLLFPAKNPKKPVDIRAPWETALEEAKITDFRFHDLRHSCASYLAMNGASLAEIAEVLGHKTLQMVKRYAHLSEQHTTTVVSRMNEKIFSKN